MDLEFAGGLDDADVEHDAEDDGGKAREEQGVVARQGAEACRDEG